MCSSVRAEEAKGSDAKGNSAAVKAYELRMDGKIEDAQKLLEKALAENPKDAAGHYELARIEWYLGLGWTEREDVDIQDLIDKAVELDPNNVIYAYFAGCVGIGQTYMSLRTGDQPGLKENFVRTIEAFESALKLKPDYHQAMLHLVDFYNSPEELGGDKSKAEQYAKQLEKMGDVPGAKARLLLLPQEVEKVDYWQKVLKKHEGNVDVLEESGRAYLGAGKVDDAVSCFEKAIEIDPEKASLFLDLSVYHSLRMLRAGDDKELFQASITSGDAALVRYIESEPVLPMLAYAIGVRAKYKGFSGDNEQKQVLFNKAKALDPHFSKATGSPHPILFIPPEEIYDDRPCYIGRPF
jgi:tetratricopeptide (TPR) repeat protein